MKIRIVRKLGCVECRALAEESAYDSGDCGKHGPPLKTWPEAAHDYRVALVRLVDAIDDAESNRGVFSTCDYHDLRCPKGRVDSAEKWKGQWICECGREELDAAVDAARELLAPPPAAGGVKK